MLDSRYLKDETMSAGPLVVTYSLTERSRQIIAEELGGVAPVI